MSSLHGIVVLVTGANGYVGRNLVAYLNKKGCRVIAATRNETDSNYFTELGCEQKVLNFSCDTKLRQQLCEVNIVFHVAADLRNWIGSSDDENFNVVGTRRLLSASRGVVDRFILVSTEAVLLSSNSMIGLSELTPYPDSPVGMYASSKQMAEKLVLQSNDAEFLCIAVRPRMVWGKDDTTILPKLKTAVTSGRFLWIANGNYLTSTTHIDNLCEGLYLAAINGRGGRVYFVTDGKPVLFRNFVTHLLRDYQGKIPTISIPYWFALLLAITVESAWRVFKIKSHPPIMCSQVYLTGRAVTIDDSLAREELGYKGLSFEELVKKFAS